MEERNIYRFSSRYWKSVRTTKCKGQKELGYTELLCISLKMKDWTSKNLTNYYGIPQSTWALTSWKLSFVSQFSQVLYFLYFVSKHSIGKVSCILNSYRLQLTTNLNRVLFVSIPTFLAQGETLWRGSKPLQVVMFSSEGKAQSKILAG